MGLQGTRVWSLWIAILILFLGGIALAWYSGIHYESSTPTSMPIGMNDTTLPTSDAQHGDAAHVPVPSVQSAPQATQGGVSLACEAIVQGAQLLISYRVENASDAAIYVANATPMMTADRNTAISYDATSVWLSADGKVRVLKGIAPMPSMPVTRPIMPLSTKLAAGASLSRTLHVPLIQGALQEMSPYYGVPDVSLFRHSAAKPVVFQLDFLRSSAPEFQAAPAELAPDLFNARSEATLTQTERLACDLPLTLPVLTNPQMHVGESRS